jgi:hypothetical protein
MTPQRFAASNIVMTAPKDMENCNDVHAYRGKTPDGELVTITAWSPTPEERVKIALGEPVWLWIYGGAMPPVIVSGDDPFQQPTNPEN